LGQLPKLKEVFVPPGDYNGVIVHTEFVGGVRPFGAVGAHHVELRGRLTQNGVHEFDAVTWEHKGSVAGQCGEGRFGGLLSRNQREQAHGYYRGQNEGQNPGMVGSSSHLLLLLVDEGAGSTSASAPYSCYHCYEYGYKEADRGASRKCTVFY
jgi:hypothetical protein